MELGEKDIWTTMKAKMCVFPSSHRAVSLDLYGRIEDALDCYSKLVEDVDSRRDDFQAKSTSLPSELEASLWEDQWVTLHRELCQWSVLSDYAKETGSLRLLMECAWKNKEWENLRSILSYPSIISLLETGDFEVKMSEIFLSIADGKLNEVENLHAQTAQICLYKWRLLPTIFSGCNAHSKLLHNFHRLVDIKESGQIMMETSAHVVAKTYPDLKNLLSVWRCRLPNEFDPISCWDDIFQWRSHMFAAITTTFNWAEQGTLASLHDRPWTAIRMAKTARKLKVKDVALLALGQLTDCAMDVSDAFSKLREQILSFKDGTDIERTGGLNLIHTTNLSYFDPQQKSELFRLKAEFLESLGSKAKMTDTFSKATKAYCHAIQLCPTYSRSWTCWGKLCWSLADLFERQSSLLDPNTVEEKEKAMATTKKVCGYLAQAMGCWMEAIQCDSGANMRAYLPRCLLMLSKDGSNPGLLCATFEKYSLSLPSWVWMTWIPQLLTSLYRLEAKTAKSILNSVLMEYPQSLYFQLRSYYLERRDLQRSQSNSSGNQSVAFAEELMSALRKNHPTLWISLESILEELIIRFRQCYEEDLLATVTALLQRADAQLEQQRRCQDSKEFDEVALRASFSTTLARVSAKFFRPQTDASSAAKEERVKRAIEFSRRYKVLFEEDFAMSTDGKEERSNSILTLSNIHEKLKKWVKILEREVSQKPPFLPLMQISPSLSSFCSSSPDLWPGACDTSFSNTSHSKAMKAQTDPLVNQSPSSSAASAAAAATAAAVSVAAACRFEGGPGAYGGSSAAVEIPGQYAPNNSNDSKPIPELNAKLSKFHPIVKFSQQGDHLVRHIGMIGSDGQYHQFLLQFAIPYWTRADERSTQLNQIFGRMIRNETLTSKRHLWFKPTPVIPIAQRLRMTAAKDCQISLENVYIAHCNNIDADHSFPIRYFTDKIRTNHSADVKVNAYRSICEEHVSSRILVEHMENDLGDVERFFHFQRNFTAQVALYSLLQYIFNANERSPNKFVFSASNAQVLHTDLRFSYSNQGFLDEKKAVPFRLTRNIQELIGPFLVDGVFIPSFASASAALNTCKDELTSTLQLLLRDDIVAWYVSKSAQREGSRSTLELEQQLTDRVAKNVAFIQERIEECTPNNEDEESPLDVGTKRLVAIATSETNLASMPATFCSWL
jgi:transformation/transcription domain-associated protein